MTHLAALDEFVLRLERVRVENYRRRFDAQARAEAGNSGVQHFGEAVCWHFDDHAAVQGLTERDLDKLPAIESYLAERDLNAKIDLPPLVECRAVADALIEAGYRITGWQPLLWRDLGLQLQPAPGMEIREFGDEVNDEFARTLTRAYGWSESECARKLPVMKAGWKAEGASFFVAYADSVPVGAATLVVIEGVARLANSATLPDHRNRGVQTALIRARLQAAAAQGLELATADARQDNVILRNLCRSGFVVAAHIALWRRA